jgi:hypothetical protein
MVIPPARLLVLHAVVSGSMMMPAEGMTDQDGVAGISVKLAIGFNHQLILIQGAAAGQCQWIIELNHLRGDDTY